MVQEIMLLMMEFKEVRGDLGARIAAFDRPCGGSICKG